MCWFSYACSRVCCENYDFLFDDYIESKRFKCVVCYAYILISKGCSSFEKLISAHQTFRENAPLIRRTPFRTPQGSPLNHVHLAKNFVNLKYLCSKGLYLSTIMYSLCFYLYTVGLWKLYIAIASSIYHIGTKE